MPVISSIISRPLPLDELQERGGPHSLSLSIGSRKIPGFTLIELLTVIAVIGILASIIMVGVSKARMAAQRTKSVGNLRACYMGISLFLEDNKMNYPGAGDGARNRWLNRVGAYMNLGPTRDWALAGSTISIYYDAHYEGIFRSAVTPVSAYGRAYIAPATNTIGVFGLNKLIRTTNAVYGISYYQIETPTRTVLLAERYAGADGTSGDQLTVDAPYGAGNPDGVCANYPSPDKNTSSTGNALFCFVDGHISSVNLGSLNPWPGNTEKTGRLQFAP